MKRLLARFGIVVGLAALSLTAALPAVATAYVQDQAGMFSAGAVAELNERISSFNAQTGKQIVVITTPSLDGSALQQAATNAFSQQNVNGVLIFIARDDRRDIIVPDRAGVQAGWFPPDTLRAIRTAMEAQFKADDYDAGVTGAVTALLGIYRAHLGALHQPAAGSLPVPAQGRFTGVQGNHISMFWWVILAVVGFLIVRSLLRAASAPRNYPGGTPPPGVPPAPGYGPGYGGYGGGGSFWSGLLGGLGGAWLGNELFRGGGGGGMAPTDSGAGWGAADSSGWQSDAGQADTSGASSGDFGGGGFGGDAGGGDFGGGGGDSGGGW
ncbi:MAG: TPM domain-containing protein [Candidatus Cybelea sp.]